MSSRTRRTRVSLAVDIHPQQTGRAVDLPPKWQPCEQGEVDVARAVRRWRIARRLNLLFLINLGLALGCLCTEAFIWARTAHWGSPHVHEIFRMVHTKLPHSCWLGVALIIDWILSQSFILCIGVLLLSVAMIFRSIAITCFGQNAGARPKPFPPKPPTPVDSEAQGAALSLIVQIQAAYRQLDATEQVRSSDRGLSERQ